MLKLEARNMGNMGSIFSGELGFFAGGSSDVGSKGGRHRRPRHDAMVRTSQGAVSGSRRRATMRHVGSSGRQRGGRRSSGQGSAAWGHGLGDCAASTQAEKAAAAG